MASDYILRGGWIIYCMCHFLYRKINKGVGVRHTSACTCEQKKRDVFFLSKNLHSELNSIAHFRLWSQTLQSFYRRSSLSLLTVFDSEFTSRHSSSLFSPQKYPAPHLILPPSDTATLTASSGFFFLNTPFGQDTTGDGSTKALPWKPHCARSQIAAEDWARCLHEIPEYFQCRESRSSNVMSFYLFRRVLNIYCRHW